MKKKSSHLFHNVPQEIPGTPTTASVSVISPRLCLLRRSHRSKRFLINDDASSLLCLASVTWKVPVSPIASDWSSCEQQMTNWLLLWTCVRLWFSVKGKSKWRNKTCYSYVRVWVLIYLLAKYRVSIQTRLETSCTGCPPFWYDTSNRGSFLFHHFRIYSDTRSIQILKMYWLKWRLI